MNISNILEHFLNYLAISISIILTILGYLSIKELIKKIMKGE